MALSAEPMARVAKKSIPDQKKGQSFFLKGQGAAMPFFQPRLTVGPVDDVYEREADAVADRVMRVHDGDMVQTKISPVALQRKCAACQDEEDHVQRKEEGGVLADEIFESAAGTGEGQDMSSAMSRNSATVQRMCAACGQEEEHVQRQEDHAGSEAPPMVSEALASSGHAMDNASQHFMESRLGYDFSHVRVHTDTVAAKSAKAINALAYTSGNDIVFGQGQYTPGTDTGKKLLAHELTHVVQQKGLQRKIQRCPDAASTAQFTTTAAQVRAHANYATLSAADRAVTEEIITLSSSRDDCIHFIDRLLVLFNTPVDMSTSVGAAASAAMATAASNEQDRLATPEGARLADIEERTARDPATNFTTMNPPARTWGHMATFQMDNRDPNNIIVQARIRITGDATDVANVVAQEDGIEKAAQEMGYTLDVIFVNTGGPNVFTVSINPAAAVDAGNWSAYNPDPSAYTHEIHHLLGLADRYDYTNHAYNGRMTISSRLGWFRIEAGRPPDPMMNQSLMGSGSHLLDDDICHVSQRDFATCMASRQARHDLVNRARGIAFGKTFNVFQTLSGIVPPSPRGDEAQTLRRARILSMAQTIFGTAVNEDQLQDIIARMRYSLTPSSPIRFAQRLDSNCTGNAHYVVNMTQPLALCPEFFTLSEEERVRVFLRGSAQMTRVDASIPVALCADNACDTACGGFNAADTWAKFVWCASAI